MSDFMQAVKWMREGKKVRISFWHQDRYIYADDNCFIMTNNDEYYRFCLDSMQNVNWVIYEPKMNVSDDMSVEVQLMHLKKEIEELKRKEG